MSVTESETPDAIVLDDGTTVDVTFRATKVVELERAGTRYTIEVGWREGELTLVDNQQPQVVPTWLAATMREWFGVDEVTL